MLLYVKAVKVKTNEMAEVSYKSSVAKEVCCI